MAGDGQRLAANFSTAGVEIDSTPKAVIADAVLRILNVSILPILKAVFFVPNLLTLGLLSGAFAFVMNAIVFAS